MSIVGKPNPPTNGIKNCVGMGVHDPHTWRDGADLKYYRCLGVQQRAPRPTLPNPPGFVTMRCLDALAHPAHPLTAENLVTAVTQLLGATAHDEGCDPVTGCGCVIGDLERALPRCTATDPDRPEWACLSLPHGDDLHFYGRRVVGATPPPPVQPMVPNTGHIMAVHAVVEGIAEVQDQLRELLSYCRTEASAGDAALPRLARLAYADVADKLAAILDGED